MKLALASLAAVLMASPAAFAQGELELSGGYTHLDADSVELGAVNARGTYFFNRYLGAEAEVAIGVKDDDFGVGKIELDNSLGAFGVVRAPIAERAELFGRVGYARSEFNASVPGLGSASDDIDGVAYGVGGKLYLTERVGLRADVTRYEGDNNEADAFTIGGVVKF